MRYFRILQDRRMIHSMRIEGLQEVVGYREAISGNFTRLPNITVGHINESSFNWYPDVIDSPFFMVKEIITPVFELYSNSKIAKAVCLLESAAKSENIYYIPQVPLVDCYSDKSSANKDKSKVNHTVLFADKIPDLYFFQVDCIKDRIIIICQAMAESILRRNPKGIELQSVELV